MSRDQGGGHALSTGEIELVALDLAVGLASGEGDHHLSRLGGVQRVEAPPVAQHQLTARAPVRL